MDDLVIKDNITELRRIYGNILEKENVIQDKLLHDLWCNTNYDRKIKKIYTELFTIIRNNNVTEIRTEFITKYNKLVQEN